MDLPVFEGMARSQRAILDSFLMISTAYLHSSERLSKLNIGTMRDAMTDVAEVSRKLASVGSAAELQRVRSDMYVAAVTKATNYARDLQTIATETQSEITAHLAPTEISSAVDTASISDAWRAAVELVASGFTDKSGLSMGAHKGNGAKPVNRSSQRMAT